MQITQPLWLYVFFSSGYPSHLKKQYIGNTLKDFIWKFNVKRQSIKIINLSLLK